jgi:hypothetical protein
MSHEVNDKLHDAIIDEIVDGLDNLDEKWWKIYNDVASEYGYHPDDDHEKIIQIMIDKEFDKRSR